MRLESKNDEQDKKIREYRGVEGSKGSDSGDLQKYSFGALRPRLRPMQSDPTSPVE